MRPLAAPPTAGRRHASPQAPPRGAPIPPALVLALATVAAFSPTLTADFIHYDDPDYIFNNPLIASGLTPETLVNVFTRAHAGNWHPLTWLSHALDKALFGPAPFGHHLVNVLIHAANAVLAFALFVRFPLPTWAAFFAAGLFALHPLRVESVAWVSERKDLLCGFFYLAACVRYMNRIQAGKKGLGPAALLFGGLALASKPAAVTLPAALVLLDLWPLGRAERPLRLVWEKRTVLLLCLGTGLIALITQSGAGATANLDQTPILFRLGNAVVQVFVYFGQTLYPANLATPRGMPTALDPLGLGPAGVVLAALGLAGLLWAAWRGRNAFPAALFGLAWFLLLLSPMIGLVQVGLQAGADRYTYLPSLGLGLAACAALARLDPPGRVAKTAGAGLCLLLGLATFTQCFVWRDSETLFRTATLAVRDNALAYGLLGDELLRRDRCSEALTAFEAALKTRPEFLKARNGVSFCLLKLGRFAQAEAWARASLKAYPDQRQARDHLAAALAGQGRMEEAQSPFADGKTP